MALSKEKQRRLKEKEKKDNELRKEQEKIRVQKSKEKEKQDIKNALIRKQHEESTIKKQAIPKKQQKLVAERNVAKLEADGWKKVEKKKDKHNRELGVRTNMDDLVLMEK